MINKPSYCKHVRINGVDFFGGDVALALQNLPAHLIRRLQLINEQRHNASVFDVDESSRVRVINLEVDDQGTRGAFAYGNTGYGSGQADVLDLGANAYNRERQLGVLVGTNNIDRRFAGSSDVARIASAGPIGINRLSGVEVTARDRFGDHMTVRVPLALTRNQSQNQSRQLSLRTIGPDEQLSSRSEKQESRSSTNYKWGNRLGGAGEALMWSKGDITINSRPAIHYQTGKVSVDGVEEEAWSQGDVFRSQQIVHTKERGNFRSNELVIPLEGFIQLGAGARFVVNANLMLNHRHKNDTVEQRISFIEQDLGRPGDSLIQQYLDQHESGRNISFTSQYTTRVLKTNSLTLVARWVDHRQSTSRYTDAATGQRSAQDALVYDNRVNSRTGELGFTWGGLLFKKLQYEVGNRLSYADRQGQYSRSERTEILDHSDLYNTPVLRLTFAANGFNFNMQYANQVTLPSLNQLNPIADDRNPRMVVIGNPDLDPSLIHFATARIMRNARAYQLNADISARLIDSRIARDQRIVNLGDGLIRQEYRFVNLRGGRQLNANYSVTQNLDPSARDKTVTLIWEGSGGIEKEVFLEDGTVGQSHNLRYHQGLSYRWRGLKDQYSLSGSFRQEFAQIPGLSGENHISRLHGSFNGKQSLWKEISLTAQLTKDFNWGYRGPLRRDPVGLSLGATGKLYRNHLTWAISAADLLDQNANQGRRIERNETIEYSNSMRGRYVLAELKWRFGSFGSQTRGIAF